MPACPKFLLVAVLLGAFASLDVHADKSTICTITVNSADEADAFRQNLSPDKFQFVELVERGRPDWLASACRKKIQCDVLVVSGHFAGTEFYSSKPHIDESLQVDEMERVACGDSCPDLFAHLKEIYLFGCDTLKREPVKSAQPEIVRGLVRSGKSRADAEAFARALSERHAENARDRMRRVFPDVPVIYGFSALAPYGRTAGPMLQGYFKSGAKDEIGSGRVSAKLLGLFAPSSMVVTNGLRETDPNADYRAEACQYYDDRLTRADKLRTIHEALGGHMVEVRIAFDRVEKFFATLTDAEKREASFDRALLEMVRDRPARERYLGVTRETEDPALRIRMIALARTVGWLSHAEQKAELSSLIKDVLATNAVGYGEVELICDLNKERELDPALQRVGNAPAVVAKPAHAAALACLGSNEARVRVLGALASPDEVEVQIAQAYLRHRPITDAAELRKVALGVARMKGSGAQVRALETLARHHVTDREILDELVRLFAQTNSPAVQRAIAEIFIRTDLGALPAGSLAQVLREHRLKPSGTGQDLVDILLSKLQAS